jgi:hypothetical protein
MMQQQQLSRTPSAASSSKSKTSKSATLLQLIKTHDYEQVLHLLKRYPEATRKVLTKTSNGDELGNLALHEVVKHQSPIKVVELVLKINEDAIKTKGQRGYLPLHYACLYGASVEVVSRLIAKYPSATRARDDQDGRLPLHMAAKSGASQDVILALLIVHPKAAMVQDRSGHTPLEYAQRLKSPALAVTALQRAPLLCQVSQAAYQKLQYKSDTKVQHVMQVYRHKLTTAIENLERQHAGRESQWRDELLQEQQRSAQLSHQIMELQEALDQKTRILEERDAVLNHIQDALGTSSSLISKTNSSYRLDKADAHGQQQAGPLSSYKYRPPTPRRVTPSPKSDDAKDIKQWFSSGDTMSYEGPDDPLFHIGTTMEEYREPPPTSEMELLPQDSLFRHDSNKNNSILQQRQRRGGGGENVLMKSSSKHKTGTSSTVRRSSGRYAPPTYVPSRILSQEEETMTMEDSYLTDWE